MSKLRPNLSVSLVLALLALVAVAGIWSNSRQDAVANDGPTALLASLPDPRDPTLKEAVARVGGATLTRFDVYSFADATSRDPKEVLAGLVEAKALYQEGIRAGLLPTDAEVDKAVSDTRATVPSELIAVPLEYARRAGRVLTVDDYWSAPALKQAYRESITVGRVREAMAEGVPPTNRAAVVAAATQRLVATAKVEILDAALR